MTLNTARLFLIGLWLGGTLLFSAVVAPVSFSVLRASLSNADELAGAIVNRTLAVVNTAGFVISLFLLLTAFVSARAGSQRWFWLEVILLAVIAMMTGVGRWVIAYKMLALREASATSFQQMGPEDPHRLAFMTLHRYAVVALSTAMLAALAAFFIIARRRRSN